MTTKNDEPDARGLCEIIGLAFDNKEPGDPCPFHSHDLDPEGEGEDE